MARRALPCDSPAVRKRRCATSRSFSFLRRALRPRATARRARDRRPPGGGGGGGRAAAAARRHEARRRRPLPVQTLDDAALDAAAEDAARLGAARLVSEGS